MSDNVPVAQLPKGHHELCFGQFSRDQKTRKQKKYTVYFVQIFSNYPNFQILTHRCRILDHEGDTQLIQKARRREKSGDKTWKIANFSRGYLAQNTTNERVSIKS